MEEEVSIRDGLPYGQSRGLTAIAAQEFRWRVRFHHLSEMVLVDVRGPNLEVLVLILTEGIAIPRQLEQRLRMALVASRFAEIRKRLEEELEGGQALLSIDHSACLNVTGWLAYVIQYDSAHEMRPYFTALQQTLSQCSYIVPKRLPLLLLGPHIGSLKEGDH